MAWWSVVPIVGKVLDSVIGLVDQVVEDKDKANALKAQMAEVFNKADLNKFTQELKSQTDIIVAEVTGKSWLQRNWRPGLMALFGVIIFNNYILNPWLSAMFSINIMMDIPPEMWSLLKLGVGGYIVGRSVEKAVTNWNNKK